MWEVIAPYVVVAAWTAACYFYGIYVAYTDIFKREDE